MEQPQIDQDSIVQWNPEAVATEVNGEVILMNFGRNRCYGLGDTGSDIWRRLAAPTSISDLLTRLRADYQAPQGEIEADVLRTLNEFASEGLILFS